MVLLSDEASGVPDAEIGTNTISVDNSAEFSYEELANATNNFSLASKIGQGGFGEVYYAELNGEVCNVYWQLLHSITCI